MVWFIYFSLGGIILILGVIHFLKIRELQEANRRFGEDRKAVVNFLNRFAHSVAMAGGNIDSTMVSLGRFIVSTIHAESFCIFFMKDEGKQWKRSLL